MSDNTKHKEDCKMAFGRKDATCPRCQELLKGATPRKGWGISRNNVSIAAELRAHDCIKSNCGPVCTAFEW